MDIDPASLTPANRYKLLIGCIVPRPIAVVSTTSPQGHHNLAPYSFFTGIGSNPMTLLFCPSNKPDGSEKDSLRNAKPIDEGGTAEFVVNIASARHAPLISAAAEPLPYGESEFDLTGLTPEPSLVVRPPRVREFAVAFECRTTHVIRTNPRVPDAGNLVIGQVVHIHTHPDLLDEHLRADPARLDAIGRMGGLTYCRTRDRFDLPRGREALNLTVS
jgi:flavin reductase (DIM6/NTAB) family NADH-FMN oxidoreductase RutF